MIIKDSEYYTTHEVGQQLGISVGSVQSLVDKGILDAILTRGGHRRICIKSLQHYKEKMGYKNMSSSKCIYIIYSDKVNVADQIFDNKKMVVKGIGHPLELLDLQDQIDCVFIDAHCNWLESASVTCINKFSKKFQIFIYNAQFLSEISPFQFEPSVIRLQCEINDSIIDAYIYGKMH